jgi:hypothetical protein
MVHKYRLLALETRKQVIMAKKKKEKERKKTEK